MKKNKNYMAFTTLKTLGYNFYDIICFLLQANKLNQTIMARQLKVTRQFVNQVIAGDRHTPRIQKAISKALGFNPWAA